MANQVAINKPQKLAAMLDDKSSEIAKSLHPGVNPETFIRIAKNAIIMNPAIAEADHTSIFIECQKAAQDGLVIDNREAALLVYNVNKRQQKNGKWTDNWIKECVYIPMVAGVMKRVRSSGMIKSWQVQVVYEEEMKQGFFEYQAGDTPYISHKPIIIGDRGDIVAAYSSVKLSDGSFHHEVMNVEDINLIRARTKSKNKKGEFVGPWRDDYAEMAKKTVIKRHSKRLPLEASLSEMLNRDGAMYDMSKKDETSYGMPEQEKPDIAKKRAKSKTSEKLGADPAKPDEELPTENPEPPQDDVSDIDPTTGEVLDNDEDESPEDAF